MTLREAANKFVELTTWIRELSTPRITESVDEEAYRENLLINFRRIGDIAQINTSLMNDYLKPVLESDRLLTDEELSVLQELKDKLLDAYTMDNLDIPFLYHVALRMYEDAERKQDMEAIVRALDDYVMVSYALLAMVRRIYPYNDSAIKVREDGLKAVNSILDFLSPEKLKTLPEGYLREEVLINSRYITTFYEYPLTPDDSQYTETILNILRRALGLLDSPEYRELVPNFDWVYHEFRTLHYFSVMTIFHNMYGFNEEQLAEINGYAKRLLYIWIKEFAHLKTRNKNETILFAVTRCSYLAGEIDAETYRKELRGLAKKTSEDTYNADEMQMTTSIPIEYILSLDPDNISEEDAEALTEFYRRMISYIHKMPKLGHLSFLLSELTFLMEHFIEIEGVIDFETICMELLAAIYPPTYVHSMSVADISSCLAKHLYKKHPEMFENVPGYPDIDDITEHVWHAAACHDIGKLFIVETIITYGRSLYNQEFDWIKTHPEAGATILSKHESTRDYVEVALGHQRWYNGQGGYPESYDPEKAENRLLVDIVACADCMDAATDIVGRSYKRGKTLDEFIEELREGSGTRYAPFLLELFEDEEVRSELETILNSGRDNKYRHTYTILDNVLR